MYKEILVLVLNCAFSISLLGQASRFINHQTVSTFQNIPEKLASSKAFLPKTFIKQKKLRIHQKNGGKAISNKDLPCDCHVQGLGWSPKQRQMVLTCQDLCSEKRGAFILLYNEDDLLPIDIQKGKSNAFFNHPSAIQISNGIFPVALAATKKYDSYIDFYSIENNQLKLKKGARIQVNDRHIGALAFAEIEATNYLIGVGWDAADLTIWKAPASSLKFEQHFYTFDSRQLLLEKEKKEWGPYNSLWLGKMEDGRVILMATHGKNYQRKSHLDIWEIVDLDTKQPQLRLLSAKKLNGKTKAGVNYFLEGVTIKTNALDAENQPVLLAAPHDFTTKNCPTGYRCSNTIYEIK